MEVLKNARGYKPDFLSTPTPVPLPVLPPELQSKVAPVSRSKTNVLKYVHYSVIQHAERKLPILTAANMNGKSFVKLKRTEIFDNKGDRWFKDPRIARQHQWGQELYSAPKSDFDKGHMTKREDVQWGRTRRTAKKAAASTFFYTNAVPQHKDVNRAIWREIEDYILHEETIEHGLRISTFTGPIFKDSDPEFVSAVKGEKIQIPTLFWKVIYFGKKKELYRLGFLVGQDGLLKKHGIVKHSRTRSLEADSGDLFADFKEADTYQVNVDFIEELSGMRFTNAWELFHDDRPRKLILETVNTRSLTAGPPRISNLVF
ncbi:MAG: DNA/RNA non-specific endonuclease [Bacteroidota bacterium]